MDEKTKDEILEQLLGEVDDFTGDKLPGDKKAKSGVEISIMVTPHGDKSEEDEEEEEKPEPEELNKGGEAEPNYGDFLKSMGC